ncbi:hypothetical protein CHS0354_000800 [Potamilus streckersoni]|uniref:Elongation factor Ts, mitochondrial n=1 Tax=Potamilus streckersoni TaxID=2493646 RepID=A0AAE0W890_9BIVA|nr:hypothetical protein CHS0354_000800 [Potamilus streckersoni]
MSDVSVKLVKELRDKTNAGMSDCKKALDASNGDIEKATKWLREKGMASASKRAGRETREGVIVYSEASDDKRIVMVELNCETDFVAKGNDFVELAKKISQCALDNSVSSESELYLNKLDGITIEEKIVNLSATLGEKIVLSKVLYRESPNGAIFPYIHLGSKLGAIVEFEGPVSKNIGRDIAMQVAACNPLVIDRMDFSNNDIEKEMEIFRNQLKGENKPSHVIEKIVSGKMEKYYQECVLLEQSFVKDPSKDVKDYLKEQGYDIKVKFFRRIQNGYGIDNEALKLFAEEIRDVKELGVQLAVVIGGGNIFRGMSESAKDMDRVQADYMGMLATVINSLALQNALEKLGLFTRCLSAIQMEQVAESYIRRRAIRHLEKGRIVIFAGGTGSPYFTTDTAASLRAVEIEADIIVKGTRVRGIYDKDPEKDTAALFFEKISYLDIIKKGIKIMDFTAITLCQENRLPIAVINITQRGNLHSFLKGELVGSLVGA